MTELIKEIKPYKEKYEAMKKEIQLKEEVLDVKQILLTKQKNEIDELNKNFEKMKKDLKTE
jgi:predicted GIY-YIG superfamily endonuclease